MKNEQYSLVETRILQRLDQELSLNLHYHGYEHTLDVLNAALIIAKAENVNEEELKLIRIAACFHDSGFLYVYQNHEVKSCELAKDSMLELGFRTKDIDLVCGMVMATKIPQSPNNLLECIIADADLDYLGRDDVFEVADKLKRELKYYFNLNDDKIWNEKQVEFLTSHHYHTEFSKKNRNPKKLKYLTEIKNKLNP